MENRHFFILVSVVFILIVGLSSVQAQTVGERRSRPEGAFSSQLWYGGGAVLGFSGSNNQSIFQIGLTPMVGYKITNNLSAGPRVSFIYTSLKDSRLGQILRSSWVDYGIGPFVRQKIYSGLFAHAEYEWFQSAYPQYVTDINGNTKLQNVREGRENAFVGLGWNRSSGGFGSDIMLLYNFLVPATSLESELSIRVGLTYNF